MKENRIIQEQCTGCGLCYTVYGCEFDRNNEGFFAPKIDKRNPLVGGKWKKLCPMVYYHFVDTFSLWGNYLNTYKGYSTDPVIRYRASSGGVLTELAIYLLESKTVDGIIQTKAKRDNPLETETIVSHCREDVLECMGSRYIGSAPLMNILSLIKNGKKYAFVGKPCDVLALKNYMDINESMRTKIVITISFFCAGMPSLIANQKLVETMGCELQMLAGLQYRGCGWPGFTTAIDQEGLEYKMDYQTAWGQYLGRDVKNICRLCLDGIGERADIVCAGLWYLDKQNKPDFTEHDGRNIIFCRTELSEKIIKEVQNEGNICIQRFTEEMDNFKFYQPYQFTRRTTMKYRVLAMKLLGHSVPEYNKKLLSNASRYSTVRENWRIFKGTIKRILQRKI